MPQAVSLTVEPAAARMSSGERVVLTLALTNAGPTSCPVRLDISGIPHEWYHLERTNIVLAPGATSDILLAVTPATDAAFQDGHYPFRVQITAPEDPEAQTSAVVLLSVGVVGALRLQIEPAEMRGQQGTFAVSVINEMPWPATILLVTWAEDDALRVRLDPAGPLVIPAGGAHPVAMRVAPRERGVARTLAIDVWGVQPGREQTAPPDLTRQVRFQYVPRFASLDQPLWPRRAPRWVLLLAPLVPLLLAAAAAGAGKLASAPAHPAARSTATSTPLPPTIGAVRAVVGGTPTVPRGAATPPARPTPTPVAPPSAPAVAIEQFVLRPGRGLAPYHLIWRTRAAQRVTLNGHPVAGQGRLVLRAPLRSAAYVLTARSGVGTHATTRVVRIVVGVVGVVGARAVSGPSTYVVTLPRIATFAVQRRRGGWAVIWDVRGAVQVRLQGRIVAPAGSRAVSPRGGWLRLVAQNGVGMQQRLLTAPRAAAVMPTALPRSLQTPHPTAAGTFSPTPAATPTIVQITIGG